MILIPFDNNVGVHLGFIKPSECRMAGEHITILRLLRLKNALLATINSKEFNDLRVFDSVCQVLMNPDFWKWTFVMCCALYAPMRVLRLADQKSAAMDKLNYYVLQTDRSDNQNGVDDDISDDGHEQQVHMLLYIAFILCIV